MVQAASTTPTLGELAAHADQRVYLHDVPWSHFEIFLAMKGDAPFPRVAYLEGELELMSPSRDHELINSVIGQVVEEHARAEGIDLWPVGSWLFRSAPKERGIEPDKCYTLGDARLKSVPDLAIEVVWTSGGIGKLEIYRGLGVSEVWRWVRGAIEVYVLDGDAYARVKRSRMLPRLDVELLGRVATKSPREALAAFTKAKKKR